MSVIAPGEAHAAQAGSAGHPTTALATSWFCSTERVAALLSVARSWQGTPFLANSCAKGCGVSCQKLAAAVYRECGCVDINVPEVPMSHARFSRRPMLEPFVDSLPQFAPTDDGVLPGDLLGFRIGSTVHHCGICLPGGQFVHAMHGLGVLFSALTDPTWSTRLACVWRPRHGAISC